MLKFTTLILVMLTLTISCQKNPIQEQIEITNDHACWLSNATQLFLYDLDGNILMSYSDLDYISDLAVNPQTRDLWAAKPAVGQLIKSNDTCFLVSQLVQNHHLPQIPVCHPYIAIIVVDRKRNG